MKAKFDKTVVFTWSFILVGIVAFWSLMVWFVLWFLSVINNYLNSL